MVNPNISMNTGDGNLASINLIVNQAVVSKITSYDYKFLKADLLFITSSLARLN